MWKLVVAFVAVSAATASAETLAVSTSGVEIPQGRVLCGAPPDGWTTDTAHRVIHVPAKATPGTRVDLRVAATLPGCAQPTQSQSVAIEVTAPWPVIEHVVWQPDEGQLEIRGHRLTGLQVRARGDKATLGTCDLVDTTNTTELCHVGMRELPAAGLIWLPAGASGVADEVLFDGDGHAVASGAPALAVDRTELAMIIRPGVAIDAVTPGGSISLRHADRIATVDCAPASCVVDGDGLLVSSVPEGATTLAVRVRLASHVVLRHGDATESSPVIRIPIVRCPLALASGAPIRGLDSQTVIVKVGGKCAGQVARMSFEIQGIVAERVHDYPGEDAAYIALRIGRTDAEALAISAVWEQGTETIAQLRVATRPPPTVRIALELGHRDIEFIPTNALATAHVTSTDWDGDVALTPVEGVYTVKGDRIRGVTSAGGLVALRVALRAHLPAPLGDMQIGTLRDTVDRPIREASSFAPLLGKNPLVELVCDEGDGPVSLTPGGTAHVPFDHHDSCRMVLHRERLDPSLGAQRLMMEVDVTRVDGSPRAEARVAKRMKLTHDETPRTLWLRGAESRFDRYTVRLSQEDDEERAREDELPSAQWTVVTGRGRARVYATSAIPTGLYRVADHDHSGILTLNFGVLARATWLDSLGREGILCLETGVLTVGLANDTSATGKSLTQVAAVGGLGLSVPIANRALAAETSVNLHAWVEFEPSRAFGSGSGNAWAFVFGPSITVGNLGADL